MTSNTLKAKSGANGNKESKGTVGPKKSNKFAGTFKSSKAAGNVKKPISKPKESESPKIENETKTEKSESQSQSQEKEDVNTAKNESGSDLNQRGTESQINENEGKEVGQNVQLKEESSCCVGKEEVNTNSQAQPALNNSNQNSDKHSETDAAKAAQNKNEIMDFGGGTEGSKNTENLKEENEENKDIINVEESSNSDSYISPNQLIMVNMELMFPADPNPQLKERGSNQIESNELFYSPKPCKRITNSDEYRMTNRVFDIRQSGTCRNSYQIEQKNFKISRTSPNWNSHTSPSEPTAIHLQPQQKPTWNDLNLIKYTENYEYQGKPKEIPEEEFVVTEEKVWGFNFGSGPRKKNCVVQTTKFSVVEKILRENEVEQGEKFEVGGVKEDGWNEKNEEGREGELNYPGISKQSLFQTSDTMTIEIPQTYSKDWNALNDIAEQEPIEYQLEPREKEKIKSVFDVWNESNVISAGDMIDFRGEGKAWRLELCNNEGFLIERTEESFNEDDYTEVQEPKQSQNERQAKAKDDSSYIDEGNSRAVAKVLEGKEGGPVDAEEGEAGANYEGGNNNQNLGSDESNGEIVRDNDGAENRGECFESNYRNNVNSKQGKYSEIIAQKQGENEGDGEYMYEELDEEYDEEGNLIGGDVIYNDDQYHLGQTVRPIKAVIQKVVNEGEENIGGGYDPLDNIGSQNQIFVNDNTMSTNTKIKRMKNLYGSEYKNELEVEQEFEAGEQ